MVNTEAIRDCLSEDLGTRLADQMEPTCESVCHILRGFHPLTQLLPPVRKQISDCLFMGVYDVLGDKLSYRDEHGTVRRLYLSDFDELADHLFYPLFLQMEKTDRGFQFLNCLAMQGSYAAQRALVDGFAPFLTEDELTVRKRTLQQQRPDRPSGRS